MRTPSLTIEDAAQACRVNVGPPGARVTSATREHVQRWLTSRGTPSARVKRLTLDQLTDAWGGTFDNGADLLTLPAPHTHQEPEPMPQINGAHDVRHAAAMLAEALAAQQAAPVLDLDTVRRIADESASESAAAMLKASTARMEEFKGDITRQLEANQERAREMVAELLANMPSAAPSVSVLEIRQDAALPIRIENAHPLLAKTVGALGAGLNVALIGPAGCGKTHLAEQAAEGLGLAFYMSGAVDSRYELSGFRDAGGTYQRTPFREAFEHGGVFLADEMDASDPGAFLWLNSALANGVQAFPDGMVRRHANFRMIGAANTFGHGADRVYVGRNQLDAASLDRFKPQLEMDYDAALEARLCGNAEWAARVQAMREAARAGRDRIVLSMRASIASAKLLAAGWDRTEVEDACLFAGIAPDVRARLRHAA